MHCLVSWQVRQLVWPQTYVFLARDTEKHERWSGRPTEENFECRSFLPFFRLIYLRFFGCRLALNYDVLAKFYIIIPSWWNIVELYLVDILSLTFLLKFLSNFYTDQYWRAFSNFHWKILNKMRSIYSSFTFLFYLLLWSCRINSPIVRWRIFLVAD